MAARQVTGPPRQTPTTPAPSGRRPADPGSTAAICEISHKRPVGWKLSKDPLQLLVNDPLPCKVAGFET
jgi:hypothetical protein